MSRRNLALPVALAGVVIVIAVFAVLVLRAQKLADGPVPIVWDKEACAHCHMHVGEPAFAAQVQLHNGAVLNFDDPGCMMTWLKQHTVTKQPSSEPRAIYVRHYKQDRWLSQTEAAFVDHLTTPMGFGLGAVDRSEPGALRWPQAEARVLQKSAERGSR